MTSFERRHRLLDALREQPGITVPQLANRLAVSEGTVRNDLDALAAEGRLVRVRGGANLIDVHEPGHPEFAARARVNQGPKRQIARRAAELVEDGDSLLLDASTTVYHLAEFLQDRHNLTVVTNGIEVARRLALDPSNTVILLGGVLRSDGMSVTGSLSEQLLRDLHIKTAFVSSSGFTPDKGLTEVDLGEVELKTHMIASAASVVALIDSSKFGKVDLTLYARTDKISRIFSDRGLDPVWIERMQRTPVLLTLCDEETCSDYQPFASETRERSEVPAFRASVA